MTDYTDETLMPFGTHSGVPLKDVPADYLLWAGDNFEPQKHDNRIVLLLTYIAKNRNALEAEVEDSKR